MPLSREEWEARKSKTISKEEWSRRKRMAALEQSKKNIAADEEGYRATSGMTGMEKFKAGIGSGLLSIMDRAGNLVGAGGRFSDEAIAEKDRLEKDLLSTGAGTGGRLVGQIAATAPVGTVLGGVAKGATMLPGASRALSMAARVPGAARVAGTGGAALEGALSGALMSDPGEGGKAALMGGALSGGMNVAGQAGGKLLRAMRPEVTDSAKTVMKETGKFVPISQALPEDTLQRQVASGFLANLPGQKLRGQRAEVVDAAREHLFAAALPDGVPVNSVFQTGDSTYDAMKHAKKVWDSAFDDINKATVKGFDVPQDVADALRKADPTTVIPRAGQSITGRNMATFKEKVQALINREGRPDALNRAARKRLEGIKTQADKRVYRDLLAQNARDQFGDPLWTKFARNSRNWNNWLKIQAAAKKAPGGEFTPQQWEAIARKSNLKEPVKDFADAAAKALKPFPSNMGPFQMRAALSLVPALGAGFYPDPNASIGDRLTRAATAGAVTFGGAGLVGKALTSKPFQKMIAQYGDEGLLDSYPELLRAFGGATRRGAIAVQNDDEE